MNAREWFGGTAGAPPPQTMADTETYPHAVAAHQHYPQQMQPMQMQQTAMQAPPHYQPVSNYQPAPATYGEPVTSYAPA